MAHVILPRDQHTLSRKHIDPDALKVLYRLSRAGHTAYLVGGGVRDLLLGRSPKDFDVSTSARPTDVKKLFRNCRLIGRRFRLAHILYGAGKVIEVSTFRRQAEGTDDDLLVRRDNTYGTPDEDAARRDFTINGLFYDIATFSVIDHIGGLSDLESRTIRTIGDPSIRFREDPIRMLRAVKFAARLDFEIAAEDVAAMREHRADLLRAAPERLNLELIRLLSSGTSVAAFKLMARLGFLDVIAPELGCRQGGTQALWNDLAGLDGLVLARRELGQDLPQAVLLGALFRCVYDRQPPRRGRKAPVPVARFSYGFSAVGPQDAAGSGLPEPPADVASGDVNLLLLSALKRLAVPRREGDAMFQALAMLPALRAHERKPAGARGLLRRQAAAREALDLWEAQALGRGGTAGEALAVWRVLLDEAPRPRRPARRGEPSRSAGPGPQDPAAAPQDDPEAPRRRRRRGGRRRRSPTDGEVT